MAHFLPLFAAAEVATAIKKVKFEKASGEIEIRPGVLKALTGEEILWLTRVCPVALKFCKTSIDWRTGVIVPIIKKGDYQQCTNYRGISLHSFPGKVYAKCLKRKCKEKVESKLENGQLVFFRIFTLKQIFEKSWEYGRNLSACFVDFEKAYNRVSRDKLWKVLQEYGVDGQLLHTIKSFYYQTEVSVRVNGKQSKPLHVSVRLRQG